MRTTYAVVIVLSCLATGAAPRLPAADGNRLVYLESFCDPYYVDRDFARLTTPQWVGEDGVEAVVVLAIDDMRDPARYEAYLRPILDRLKQIDGRAPVSIMTCRVDQDDPQLQKWLDEGLSLEVHTVDHPCPLLQGGDFGKAKGTYDRCVDLLNRVPGNRPVAFRMPCCDSRNTPSPRFWEEIFNERTPEGHFLRIDTSVFNITTSNDPDLPRELVEEEGGERFRKYLPFPSFVNTIEDYPYPYVIGGLCWEFPCIVPSDWEAQNLQKPHNPRTVADMQAALDAVVVKQGVYNLVFHPHGWIRNDQIVELIDHAVAKHGRKVKFLTFREAADRLRRHLLNGHPLRDDQGRDNGVRIADVNNDGFLDVVIGSRDVRKTRVWSPADSTWNETDFPTVLTRQRGDAVLPSGAHFGVLRQDGAATVIGPGPVGWHFVNDRWESEDRIWAGIPINGPKVSTRLCDLDGDGICEMIEANWAHSSVFRWEPDERIWERLSFVLPAGRSPLLESDTAEDIGLRLFDVNADGKQDVLFSTPDRYSLHLFKSLDQGWSPPLLSGRRAEPSPPATIPPFVRPDGTNNGVWFHSGHLWVQNEDTDRLPDGVDRRSFEQLLNAAE